VQQFSVSGFTYLECAASTVLARQDGKIRIWTDGGPRKDGSAKEKILVWPSFFLDSSTQENYTFDSCSLQTEQRRCSPSIGSAGKRNQGKARKKKATHPGNALEAFPDVFLAPSQVS
jgi:hypothetical protein